MNDKQWFAYFAGFLGGVAAQSIGWMLSSILAAVIAMIFIWKTLRTREDY
jgi:hypothetical protein